MKKALRLRKGEKSKVFVLPWYDSRLWIFTLPKYTGKPDRGQIKMTKQEEIDWGLRELIRKLTGEEGTVFLYDASKKIRNYLQDNDVVVKVDRELPNSLCAGCSCYFVKDGRVNFQKELDKAGYVAVESLI